MLQHNGRSVVERVRAWCGWFNPRDINRKGAKEGARYAHGVNGGSQVLTEIRQRGLCGGTRASYLKIAFKDRGLNPGGNQNDRG